MGEGRGARRAKGRKDGEGRGGGVWGGGVEEGEGEDGVGEWESWEEGGDGQLNTSTDACVGLILKLLFYGSEQC